MLTGKLKGNDCQCNPCPQNGPIVDTDLQTTSRSRPLDHIHKANDHDMTMIFVDFIPDPYEAIPGEGGGGEPLCKPSCFKDIDFKFHLRRENIYQTTNFGIQKRITVGFHGPMYLATPFQP